MTLCAAADAERTKIAALAEAEHVRLEAEAQAGATRMNGDAEAAATQARGLAEGEAVRARALAEAESIKARGDALEQHSEAVIGQQLAERWREIVEACSALSHRECARLLLPWRSRRAQACSPRGAVRACCRCGAAGAHTAAMGQERRVSAS